MIPELPLWILRYLILDLLPDCQGGLGNQGRLVVIHQVVALLLESLLLLDGLALPIGPHLLHLVLLPLPNVRHKLAEPCCRFLLLLGLLCLLWLWLRRWGHNGAFECLHAVMEGTDMIPDFRCGSFSIWSLICSLTVKVG